MKYLVLALLLVSSLISADLHWSHDYNATLKKSQKSGKLVYVLITSENCKWCRKFENTTLQNKEILQRLYKEFELVHISREHDFVPEKFKTSPVPRHYFTDAQGNILYSSLGHRGVECFDSFMDNAQNKLTVSK
jgi:thiol-disulfide isomerase/thioredoxin